MKNADNTNTKKYKVIEIPTEKEIIINYGSEDKASLADIVNIVHKKYEVFDKSQNTNLGTRYIFKEKLSIVEIYPKFSVCKKEILQQSILLDPIKTISTNRVISADLNVNSDDISGNGDTSDICPIKIDDEVIINFDSTKIK